MNADRQKIVEITLDGLVGPNHNYAGLAWGNLASERHAGALSHPKAAALQGLAKARLARSMGTRQGLAPPPERPCLAWLHRLGWTGTSAAVVARLAREEPRLLATAYSASSMWMANAATSAPPIDRPDDAATKQDPARVIPANLLAQGHRALETPHHERALSTLLAGAAVVEDALPSQPDFADEGAANHHRFEGDQPGGLHLFVYGRDPQRVGLGLPQRAPARQSAAASRALRRRLGVEHAVMVQQHPRAIDAGVFHNDVAAMGTGCFFIHHEEAFAEGHAALRNACQRFGIHVCSVPSAKLSLEEAVQTYFFNSQLWMDGEGRCVWLAPQECQRSPRASALVEEVRAQLPVDCRLRYVDLGESMRNGGGPACLRLRVWLPVAALGRLHPHCLLAEQRWAQIEAWVHKHYRDELRPSDLADPCLIDEIHTALDELTQLLELGSFYSFQRAAA